MLRNFLLAFVLLTTVANVFAQPTRKPMTALPPEKALVGPGDDPLQNFSEKGLPEPIIIGGEPSSTSAASAAKEILKYDERSLSVLIAAIRKSGFSIINSNQKVLYPPVNGGNGMAFYDFEVAGMLRSSAMGAVTTVAKLTTSLENGDADMKALGLGTLILNDLQRARSSKDPQNQFLATLIFELGKGVSDLATATPAQARLNLMQASLLERTLLGDFLFAYETWATENGSLRQPRQLFGRPQGVTFMNVSWRPNVDDCGGISDITKLQGYESKVKKIVDLIFGSGTMPSVWNGPKSFVKKKFENFAKGVEKANLVLAWVKMVIAYMNLEAKITVEDPLPLIRTKHNRNSGQDRIVTGNFSINFPKATTINCTGKAIKAVIGLDLSVPDHGPLKNVPVKWLPVLEGRGYERFSEYPVWLDANDSTRGDISKQKTDDAGNSKIKLTGKPQARNLENEAVVPLGKKAELKVSVATEDMDASEDIPKIFWFGVGGDFGVTALIELAPDIMAKMALKDFRVVVPVRDWQPCSQDWGGTIRAVLEQHATLVIKANKMSNGNSTGDGMKTIHKIDEVNVTLNPRTEEERLALKPMKPAYLDLRGSHREIDETKVDANPCCGPKPGSFRLKVTQGREMKYFQTQSRSVSAVVRSSERDFELILSVDSNTFPVVWREFKDMDTDCPDDHEAYDRKVDSQYSVNFRMMPGRYGDRYVNTAGEVLQGTKSFPMPNNTTITWWWNLARCNP